MGWRGEISFTAERHGLDRMIHDIQLKIGPDARVKFLDYCASTASEPARSHHVTPPRVLLLDVDCIKSSMISLDEKGDLSVCGCYGGWRISRGPLQPKALYELFGSGKWELLKLGWDQFMIVENGMDFAVRTGVFIIGADLDHFWTEVALQRKWIRLG
jgi:hypothetical protein